MLLTAGVFVVVIPTALKLLVSVGPFGFVLLVVAFFVVGSLVTE